MRVRPAVLAMLLAAGCIVPALRAQETSAPPVAGRPATIDVFLDCEYQCDFDFIRTEIPYVNWVRDRTVSDVHLLVTTQGTGGGGSEYVLTFIGQRAFAQTVDTLKYTASVNATADDRRKGYTRTIKTGLVQFLARTTLADRLQISLTTPAANSVEKSTPKFDPWRAWVFNLSGNGYMNGEKSYKSFFGFFDTEASRTTAAWKSSLGGEFTYDQSDFTVEMGNTAGTGDTTYTTIQRNWDTYGTQLKSLTSHWSAGVTGSLGSQSFRNQKHYAKAKAALEYDLFPYNESTRRQLRIQYGVGFAHYQYEDTTVYLKTQETVPVHYLSIAASARQPWGSLNANLTRNALLLAPEKRSTRISTNMNVRIVKGLSFNMGGSYEWIHDQLYLPKGSATTTSVLLRQQALRTAYSYYGNIGLSYTFGSIFNNVVNPRFGNNNVF